MSVSVEFRRFLFCKCNDRLEKVSLIDAGLESSLCTPLGLSSTRKRVLYARHLSE